MNLNVKDEILSGEPKYKIKQNDTTLYDNVTIEMVTPVQQQGTPINKELFDTISKYLIPTGIICMWSGSAVPGGWHLCDGTDGTPDLRNRFIVGAGSTYNIGNTGGSDSVVLTENQMPSHTHETKMKSEDSPYWGYTGTHNVLGTHGHDGTEGLGIPKKGIHSGYDTTYDIKIETTSTGSNEAHENRPPYYALAYIMKIAE